MNRCFNCAYMWVDCDENGAPVTKEYCHFIGPEDWAPCGAEEWVEPEDYPELDEL